ncbi:MAG TPA: hypothetical protein VFC70_02005, partial [Oscillospiraceae bacterium]|nr:hypothetical protein [Oscillospiraceae bacterium]
MKNKSNRKDIIVYISIILVSVLFIIIGNKVCQPEVFEQEIDEFYKAKVVSVGEIEVETFGFGEGNDIENKKVHFTAKITNGIHKGEIVEAIQDINDMHAIQPNQVKRGKNIIISLMIMGETGDEEWIFIEHNRSDILRWFII